MVESKRGDQSKHSHELFLGNLGILTDIYTPEYAQYCTKVLKDFYRFHSPRMAQAVLNDLIGQKPEGIDQETIHQLSEYSEVQNWIQKDRQRVEKGSEVLRNLFLETEMRMALGIMNNPTLLKYGSLQYGDPDNFDADLLGIAKGLPAPVVRIGSAMDWIQTKLMSRWEQEVSGEEPQLFLLDQDAIMNPEEISMNFSENGLEEEAFGFLLDVAPALTGEPVYEEDREFVKNFQSELSDVVGKLPLARAFVNTELKETLAIRKQRRMGSM